MYYSLTIKCNLKGKNLSNSEYNVMVKEICSQGDFTWHKTTYERDSIGRNHVHCILEHENKNVRYSPFFRKGYMIYFRKVYSKNWESYIEKDIMDHSYNFL